MDYIDAILERADLQQIVNYMLYGTGETNPQKYLYKDKIEKMDEEFISLLEAGYVDKKRNEIEEKYLLSTAQIQNIYTEIGIKICFKILIQLQNFKGNN